MKKAILLILMIIVVAFPDVYGQRKRDRVKTDSLSLKSDSTEYELIIIDPGFEHWLVTKPTMGFHSNEYYRQKNIQYVSEWNSRYMTPSRHRGIYATYIDYDPFVEYDIELNYKLFYYFQYFEEKNRVKLLPPYR